jgi:cell division protein FtsW
MRLATTTLAFCVAALLSLGMVILYSSKAEGAFLARQLVWCGIGLSVCVAAALVDYRKWKKLSPIILIFAVVLLILVFAPYIGIEVNGARRWIGYGGFTMQPSEAAKLALIFFIAWYGERYQRHMPAFRRGLIYPSLVIVVVLGLIFKEPDVGTTILLGGVSAGLLLLAGVRWVYFLPPVAAASAAVVFFLLNDPMRSKRIYSWLNLEETRQGMGMQAYQAMIALGAGGISGRGLGDGRQKLGWIPEHHTDFIFSIIGEELGLVATMGVVVLFFVIVVCGFYIALQARDPFGMLVASGLTMLIGLQAFINMGVVTGVLPNKGISLPFISYGGSSLVVTLCAVGILFSIARCGPTSARKTAAVEDTSVDDP